MTQGNAIDAGPGPRDALLARLAELRGLAGEAEAEEFASGPWEVDPEPSGGMLSVRQVTAPVGTGYVADADARRPDLAAHIAAHSPDLMGAVWEGLAEEVRRHRPSERVHPNPGGPNWTEPVCRACEGANADPTCPFVLRWCRVLGVGAVEASAGVRELAEVHGQRAEDGLKRYATGVNVPMPEPGAVVVDVCHNGHPFMPGICADTPDQPNPLWCNTCGETRRHVAAPEPVGGLCRWCGEAPDHPVHEGLHGFVPVPAPGEGCAYEVASGGLCGKSEPAHRITGDPASRHDYRPPVPGEGVAGGDFEVVLICCGTDDGVWGPYATWAEADAFRERYVASGETFPNGARHERVGIVRRRAGEHAPSPAPSGSTERTGP